MVLNLIVLKQQAMYTACKTDVQVMTVGWLRSIVRILEPDSGWPWGSTFYFDPYQAAFTIHALGVCRNVASSSCSFTQVVDIPQHDNCCRNLKALLGRLITPPPMSSLSWVRLDSLPPLTLAVPVARGSSCAPAPPLGRRGFGESLKHWSDST